MVHIYNPRTREAKLILYVPGQLGLQSKTPSQKVYRMKVRLGDTGL